MCRIDYCDDMATVLTDKMPVASKHHPCTECRRVIEPGERYEYQTTLCDGRVSTHKTCRHCLVVRDWINANCGGWIYGEIEEEIEEHYREQYGFWCGRMAVGMRNFWRRRDGSLMPVPTLPS